MFWVFFSMWKVQDMRYYKVFSTWWVYTEGWVLVGFGWGLHYRTRKGDVPRLILLWQSLPFLQKDCGNVGKEGVCDTFWCTPVLGEQVCCLVCNWSNLPCPLQLHPCFSFSHHLRKRCFCGVSLCVRWSWWTDVIWQYNYNCRKNRKNGTFFFRMLHPVLTFIWHIEVLMLHVLQ